MTLVEISGEEADKMVVTAALTLVLLSCGWVEGNREYGSDYATHPSAWVAEVGRGTGRTAVAMLLILLLELRR